MSVDFVHLHVSSSYSMRYGASSPFELVQRAAELDQRILALTDRDGLYGAVRFVQACKEYGLGAVLGVNLAVRNGADSGRPERRTGVSRPGSAAGEGPRITVLARGADSGMAPGQGWRDLCRLVTTAHHRRGPGGPVCEPADFMTPAVAGRDAGRAGSESLGPHRAQGSLVVLLGPDSDVGRALQDGRRGKAEELLHHWTAALPPGSVVIELSCSDGPAERSGSLAHCRALARLARQHDLPLVLTAGVRHARPEQYVVADLLDASRRSVPLAPRHLEGTGALGCLADSGTMYALARRLSGDDALARELLRQTVALAEACVQSPRGDLGIGSVRLPEPEVLGLRTGADAGKELSDRCQAAISRCYPGPTQADAAARRLDQELSVISALGYPTYFLAVAAVVDLVRHRGIRVAARGSGAGSLVNYLLGISGVDPLAHGLLMERFCTPLRTTLPDIDIDVESARRPEIYEAILGHFGRERVACVSMAETYRIRHAIRDVGAALSLSPLEIDRMAKAFPHIRARDARRELARLPELRNSGYDVHRLERFFGLVESLDGLPRHIALHPCGVLISDGGMLDRTPVEPSGAGYPMSQFDKDDVEALGFLKLDVLGVRMQSAMAHAVAEIERVEGRVVDLDSQVDVPLTDPATYELIRACRTVGCFQIESPGQRELIGRFGPKSFEDIVIDISLFRPGPVKADMITPFLRARHGWAAPELLHPTLAEVLEPTAGVMVFHEQMLRIIAITTGASLAEADEVRRAMATAAGVGRVETWWRERAVSRGYTREESDRIWAVLAGFASFGFCKAHAAAFALTTFQSAWLKTHHPAAFYAGLLSHDPGMYPKRFVLQDARRSGVAILGLDVNRSTGDYRVEEIARQKDEEARFGVRMSLADVSGISQEETRGIVEAAPYRSLDDFWQRAQAGRALSERLIMAGGFDALHGLDLRSSGSGQRGAASRRDLQLRLGELSRGERLSRRNPSRVRSRRSTADSHVSRGAQLLLDFEEQAGPIVASGLPDLSQAEQIQAELEVLGMDVSAHALSPYEGMLADLRWTRAVELDGLSQRSHVLVAGVKVATQTPPVRSGRRVVFLTLDDGSGPIDATFFEEAQYRCSTTIFASWLLLVRGTVRRSGERGLSLLASGAWELSALLPLWQEGGRDAVLAQLDSGRELVPAGGSHRREPVRRSPRKVWYASPGSSGH